MEPNLPALERPEEGAAAASCPDCGAAGARRFCPECGNPRPRGPVTVRAALADLREHVIGLESPMLRTAVDLLRRRGAVGVDWIAGRRRTYANPIRFCFVAGGIAVLVTAFMPYESALQPPPERRAMMEAVGAWVHVLTLATLPLLALCMAAAFRRRGRTYAEHLVMACFAYGETFLLQALGGIVGLYAWKPSAFVIEIGALWIPPILTIGFYAAGPLRTFLGALAANGAYLFGLGAVLELVFRRLGVG